jgi:hypothetical protein
VDGTASGEQPLQTLSLRPAVGAWKEIRGFWRAHEVEHRVSYEDFCVDGVALYPRLLGRIGMGTGHDVSTALRPDDPATAVDAIQRLLGLAPADFAGERMSLYVCLVCGDLGCASLSTRLVDLDDRVAWAEIGWQVNDEEGFVPEPDVGPFAFDRPSYVSTLTAALRRYERLAQA